MSTGILSISDETIIARNNLLIYAVCRALAGSATVVHISLGGLAGAYLLAADKSFATAPITSFNIGVALGTIPASAITKWLGRKYGFIFGLLVGIIGLLISAWGLIEQSFVIFCFGAILNGIAGGFGQLYRFAATDHGTAQFRQRAISWVLVGGIIAAAIASPITYFGRDLLLPTQFAGAYLVVTLMLILSVGALGFLKSGESNFQKNTKTHLPARRLATIMAQPRFVVGVFCGTSAYAMMSFIMTGAPLAMVKHGFSLDHAAFGIQWHVVAMYAPSFFTGNLMNSYGQKKVIFIGLIIILASSVIALMGLELWNFWLSLVLLGLGWNFAFIGTTSLITDTYRENEKNMTQGANDVVLFSTVAFSSLMSGFIFSNYGWDTINHIVFVIIIPAICVLLWLQWQEQYPSRRQSN